MDPDTLSLFAIALTITLGITGPAFAIGKIGSNAVKGISRNPEAASKIQTSMILSIAFAEALGIYSLIIALVLKFVK